MFHTASFLRHSRTHHALAIGPVRLVVFVCALMVGCHQAGTHVVSGDISPATGLPRPQLSEQSTDPNVAMREDNARSSSNKPDSAISPNTVTETRTVTKTGPVALLGIEPFGEPSSTNALPQLLSVGWSPTPSPSIDAPTPPAVLPVSLEFGHSSQCDCRQVCPKCTQFTFKDDSENFLAMLRDDARGVVNRDNLLVLGVGLAGALVIRHDLDKRVRNGVESSPLRWGDGTRTLGHMADPQYQVPVILAIYAHSLRTQDEELHEFSKSLLSAFTITGLTTLGVKVIANTDRPTPEWNGGHFGFPSYHAASSFTIAAVVDEYYGPSAAVPAYALAGLIGWSRIDEQDHDLSDVVFGAVLGYVVGKSVAKKHRTGDSRLRMLPYVHPTDGTTGLLFDWPF